MAISETSYRRFASRHSATIPGDVAPDASAQLPSSDIR